MVSYYTPMSYSQKHSAANLAYSAGQPWNWPTNYHTAPNHQFLSDMEPTHPHHQVYYNAHMFHTPTAGTPSEWHSPTSSAENYSQNAPTAHQMLQQHHVNNLVVGSNGNGHVGSSSASSGGSSTSSGPASGNTQLNETASSIGEQHIAEGLPSPPITVSGSEISSPGAPNSSSSPHHIAHHLNNNNNNNNSPSAANNNNNPAHHNNNRTSPVKPQYYEWMKKPTYPAQPAPGTLNFTESISATSCLDEDYTENMETGGKTRTKDKYRVVYTDYQRLELEKEYCTSRYITIRRKTELAQSLSLSERQVKIWFQNRRAKERKQNKKGSDSSVMSAVQHNDYMMDTKPKLESGLHLQTLQSLNSMTAMGMSTMRLHHHLPHPSLTMSAVAAAHSHQLHQPTHAQMSAHAAAAAGVGSLAM